ncbi:hypothetical protein BDR26DRAFT_884821 [Obelidium mucronatum]|nr:hypothetical protein BDR26DRAFT_884821 [Obelidium mucronatum]
MTMLGAIVKAVWTGLLGPMTNDAAVLNVRIPEERVVAASRQCCLDSVMQGCSFEFTFPQNIDGRKETHIVCRDCFKFLRIQNLFWRGFHYNDIRRRLRKDGFVMLDKTLRRYLRQQNWNRHKRSPEEQEAIERIAIEKIRWYRETNGPSAGYRTLTHWLHVDQQVPIARDRVLQLLKEIEPGLIQDRKRRRLKRLNYTGKGPWEMCSFDQHDKFRFYGLFLHGGIDCYSRYLMWLKVWRTNRQSALVAFWYLSACWEYGSGDGIFRETISDRGCENVRLGRLQTDMRHELNTGSVIDDNSSYHLVVQDSRLNQKMESYWALFLRVYGNDILNQLLAACQVGTTHVLKTYLTLFLFM